MKLSALCFLTLIFIFIIIKPSEISVECISINDKKDFCYSNYIKFPCSSSHEISRPASLICTQTSPLYALRKQKENVSSYSTFSEKKYALGRNVNNLKERKKASANNNKQHEKRDIKGKITDSKSTKLFKDERGVRNFFRSTLRANNFVKATANLFNRFPQFSTVCFLSSIFAKPKSKGLSINSRKAEAKMAQIAPTATFFYSFFRVSETRILSFLNLVFGSCASCLRSSAKRVKYLLKSQEKFFSRCYSSTSEAVSKSYERLLFLSNNAVSRLCSQISCSNFPSSASCFCEFLKEEQKKDEKSLASIYFFSSKPFFFESSNCFLRPSFTSRPSIFFLRSEAWRNIPIALKISMFIILQIPTMLVLPTLYKCFNELTDDVCTLGEYQSLSAKDLLSFLINISLFTHLYSSYILRSELLFQHFSSLLPFKKSTTIAFSCYSSLLLLQLIATTISQLFLCKANWGTLEKQINSTYGRFLALLLATFSAYKILIDICSSSPLINIHNYNNDAYNTNNSDKSFFFVCNNLKHFLFKFFKGECFFPEYARQNKFNELSIKSILEKEEQKKDAFADQNIKEMSKSCRKQLKNDYNTKEFLSKSNFFSSLSAKIYNNLQAVICKIMLSNSNFNRYVYYFKSKLKQLSRRALNIVNTTSNVETIIEINKNTNFFQKINRKISNNFSSSYEFFMILYMFSSALYYSSKGGIISASIYTVSSVLNFCFNDIPTRKILFADLVQKFH